jgi:hypothetical protein
LGSGVYLDRLYRARTSLVYSCHVSVSQQPWLRIWVGLRVGEGSRQWGPHDRDNGSLRMWVSNSRARFVLEFKGVGPRDVGPKVVGSLFFFSFFVLFLFHF